MYELEGGRLLERGRLLHKYGTFINSLSSVMPEKLLLFALTLFISICWSFPSKQKFLGADFFAVSCDTIGLLMNGLKLDPMVHCVQNNGFVYWRIENKYVQGVLFNLPLAFF